MSTAFILFEVGLVCLPNHFTDYSQNRSYRNSLVNENMHFYDQLIVLRGIIFILFNFTDNNKIAVVVEYAQ